jgi:asparagine synthase (glutamine-hydrolysing)
MCGIAGIAGFSDRVASLTNLEAMSDTLTHRGPDGAYADVSDGVGLAMRRLAIIDVQGGRQPYFNETRDVRVIFNGEIYNFRELRSSLEAKGHSFHSHTDGEVIPHLWEEHGEDFVRHLNGMFAIALHDARRQRLVLVRDRIGIKPLYYSICDSSVVFGSEIKAILASGLTERTLDVDALGQLMAWEYIPPPATLFRDIRKLASAEMLVVDLRSRRTAVRRYWDLPMDRSGTSEGQPNDARAWADRIESKIHEAVQRQMVSDVPLGAFLSGGVDSSLVASMMGDNAQAFSIGFDDPTYSEVQWARRVASHLGLRHRVDVIKPDIGSAFDTLMHHMDDPIGDFSIFPTWLVSRVARDSVTVVLSGDGGDEVFGGYETYVAQQASTYWRRIPRVLRDGLLAPAILGLRPTRAKKGLVNKARRFVEGAALPGELGHTRWRVFLTERQRETLFTPEALAIMPTPAGAHIQALAERAPCSDPVARGLYIDLNSYLPDNCLVKVDRMSMAVSLEARVPLLDHELVELAFRVPSALKVRRTATKILLKQITARRVPRDCVYRQKEGFSIPIKNWLCDELRPMMEDLLAPATIGAEGLFRPDAVERLKREHLAGQANHSHVLWTLMVFQDWRRRWAA